MRALARSASLLRRAARSAPTTAALHQPAPGVGPCTKAWKHSLIGEEKNSFLTAADLHNAVLDFEMKDKKSINDLNQKFNKSFLEYKISLNMAMVQLKCDLRKESSDKHNKHYLEHVGTKNELKILEQKFETHKLNISHLLTQGTITLLKNFGWGVGAGSAILARFGNLRKVFFKNNGKE